MMTLDEAILALRSDPSQAWVVREAYLGEDVLEAGERFLRGPEFAETLRLLGPVAGKGVLDVGAGRGIASYAFAKSGAAKVWALEPDPSPLVGQASLRELCRGLDVELVAGVGEDPTLAVPDSSVDIVYARQVLHHIPDLPAALKNFARVLRPGGLFLAAREHVAEGPEELAQFLAAHPVHRLAGGEHAWPLKGYRGAIASAGLELRACLGPWQSLLNAVPLVGSQAELDHYVAMRLERKFGAGFRWLADVPGIAALLKRHYQVEPPGRLYSFLARKRSI